MSKEKLDLIINKYSQLCTDFLNYCTPFAKTEREKIELENFKRKNRLCPKEEKIKRSALKLWAMKEIIINRNLNELYNFDFKLFATDDENIELIDEMAGLIKKRSQDLSEQDINRLWEILIRMLQVVIEYKQLT